MCVLKEITTHPQNKVLAVNSVVNFICTSSLLSNVIFSWTHNGTSIHGWSTTGDTSILTIANVRHSDAGSYECTVSSGSVSVMSNSATLTVYGKWLHTVIWIISCSENNFHARNFRAVQACTKIECTIYIKHLAPMYMPQQHIKATII